MGLIKNIKDAVKKEVKDYIFQMVEVEKENEKKPEQPSTVVSLTSNSKTRPYSFCLAGAKV